jgi:hypothetical protein
VSSQLRISFNSNTQTVEGTWISPSGQETSAFKSVSRHNKWDKLLTLFGIQNRFGIEGDIILCPPHQSN